MKILTVIGKNARSFQAYAGATFELRTLLSDGRHFINPTIMDQQAKLNGLPVSNELLHSQDARERPYPSDHNPDKYTRQLLTLMQASVGYADTGMMLVPQSKRETTAEDDDGILISLTDPSAAIDNAFGEVNVLMPRFFRMGRGSRVSVRTSASKGALGLSTEYSEYVLLFKTQEEYVGLKGSSVNNWLLHAFIINDLLSTPSDEAERLMGRKILWR